MANYEYNKEAIKCVIQYLDLKGKKAQKITVQKMLYFLSCNNFPVSYIFEPYKYGPFSKELANDLDELMFWDELIQSSDTIKKGENFYIQLDTTSQNEIDEAISRFLNILNNDLSFNKLEIVTTLMYNIKALKEFNKDIGFDEVFEEFVAWKGSKFQKSHIEEAYRKLI